MAAPCRIDSCLDDVDFSFLDDLTEPASQAGPPQEVPLFCDEVLSPTPDAGPGAADGGEAPPGAQARGRYAKHWCFTVNHPTDDELADLACLAYAEPAGNVRYLVMGREVGETGTPHLQCYVELQKRERLPWLKQYVSSRAHFEPRFGTREEVACACFVWFIAIFLIFEMWYQ